MLNEEEKKAITSLRDFAYTLHGTFSVAEAKTILNLIEKQQHIIEGKECVISTQAHNEKVLLEQLEKQNKIIDKMADEIYDLGQKQDTRNDNITIWVDKEHILNYFTKSRGGKMI